MTISRGSGLPTNHILTTTAQRTIVGNLGEMPPATTAFVMISLFNLYARPRKIQSLELLSSLDLVDF